LPSTLFRRPPGQRNELGLGQFIVADFRRIGFVDVLRQLDDVRVVQALSAGV
jgi:hypothetical protein